MNPEIVNILYNFLPELTLSLAIVTINILHLFKRTLKTAAYLVFITGLTASLIFTLLQAYTPMQSAFGGLLVLDHLSYFGKLITFSAILFIALFFFHKEHSSNEFLLILSIALSTSIAASSSSLVLTFISLELISISIYMMISNQGKLSFRYFVYGSVLSGMMLFGITILYGVCGSFEYSAISRSLSINPFNTLTVTISVILITAGFAFKTYLLPFNFLYPSLAEKSELKSLGLLSISVPALTFVVMLRFFTVAFLDSGSFISETNSINFIPDVKWNIMFSLVGTLSVLAGNLVILWQQNLKKITSFLVIAQSGFVIMGLSSPSTAGTEAMLYNVMLFTASGCGIFFCMMMFEDKYDITTLSALKGLGKTDPLLIIAFVIFLLSFAGFPLTGGFTGRLLVLPALMEHGFIAPVMILVLNSIALLYFIFKLSYSSFSAVPDKVQSKTGTLNKIVLLILLIPVIITGLFPEPFTSWIRFCREVFKAQIL